MAHITYFIGNGFDLNLGLETDYNSFIDWYIEQPSDDDLIEWFKANVARNKKLWSDVELAFGAFTEEFKTMEDSSNSFNRCQEDIIINLANYLKEEQDRLNNDALSEDTERLKIISKNLIDVAGGLKLKSRREVNSRIQAVGEGFVLDFLVFNYTETLEPMLDSIRNTLGQRRYRYAIYENVIQDIVHVHGTVNGDIILAVNDITQIKAPEIFDSDGVDLSAMIKEQANDLCENDTEENARATLNKSDIIYIYGMSIGATDKRWWERIIQRMLEKPNLCLIIYSREAPDDTMMSASFVKYRNRKTLEFLSNNESLTPEQIEALSRRIYIDRVNKFSPIMNIVNKNDSRHK